MPNKPNSLTRLGGSALLVVAMLLSAPSGALASPAAGESAAPASPTAITLWDQSAAGNTDGGTTVSSKFESFPLCCSNYDSQAGDDFENDSGAPWEITQVNVHGTYEGGTGNSTVTSLLVQIYSNNTDQPGQLLISQTVASGAITGLSTGDFIVTLVPSLIVGPGRYWLSVQAFKPDFIASSGRQWSWFEKEDQVLNGSVWRQPGNAYGKNCFDFRPRVSVCDQPTNSDNYDLLFRIIGNTGGVPNPVPIETSLQPGSRTPAGPSFQFAVAGINFVSDSKIVWNGTELTPSAWSGTRLTVTVPSGYIAVSGAVPVLVRNPAPGGGDSNALTFYIGTRIFAPFIRR